jgi:hypothetical protein
VHVPGFAIEASPGPYSYHPPQYVPPVQSQTPIHPNKKSAAISPKPVHSKKPFVNPEPTPSDSQLQANPSPMPENSTPEQEEKVPEKVPPTSSYFGPQTPKK